MSLDKAWVDLQSTAVEMLASDTYPLKIEVTLLQVLQFARIGIRRAATRGRPGAGKARKTHQTRLHLIGVHLYTGNHLGPASTGAILRPEKVHSECVLGIFCNFIITKVSIPSPWDLNIFEPGFESFIAGGTQLREISGFLW